MGGADGGSRTRACALRGRRASGNTSSTWSRLEDSNLDSPVIGRTSCLLDEAWVGPAGWSRTSLVPLKRRAHGRSATTGATRRALAVGPGFEPGSFRLTAGRVAVATTLQMVGSGGLEPPRACARGRWAADYPTTRRTSWGERPESNRLERVHRPAAHRLPSPTVGLVAGEGIEPPCAVCRTAVLPLNEPAVGRGGGNRTRIARLMGPPRSPSLPSAAVERQLLWWTRRESNPHLVGAGHGSCR